MIRLAIAAAVWLAAAVQGFAEPPRLTVWAWERPEDLRFLPTDVDIAVQSGFIVLAGDTMTSRSRRFPLFANPQQVTTSVVHLQIDHRKPLDWTPQLRARTAAAVVQPDPAGCGDPRARGAFALHVAFDDGAGVLVRP